MNERIRELLKIKGLTDEYISEKVGISTHTIELYKAGIEYPNIAFLEFLVIEHPNLDLNWLIMGYGEMYHNEKAQAIMDASKLQIIEKQYQKLENMYDTLELNFKKMEKRVEQRIKNSETKYDRIMEVLYKIQPPEIKHLDRAIENLYAAFDKLNRAIEPLKIMKGIYTYKKSNPRYLTLLEKDYEKSLKRKKAK